VDSWLVALLVALGILLLSLLLPLRVELSLRARGDPSGAWAVAGGVEITVVALSGVAARGVPASVAAHLLGKQIWSRRLSELGAKPDTDERGFVDKQKARYAELERWFDPVDLALFALGERRRFRIEKLDIDVDFSFADVATTGKMLAGLYALSGALPPPIAIRPRPSWDSVDRAEVALSGRIRLMPGLLLVDLGLFVVRNVKLGRRRAAADRANNRAEAT
jgi:hypothetical protein